MNALNIASRFVNDIAENIAQTCFLVHPANVEGSSWLKSLLSVLGTVQVRAALGFQLRGSLRNFNDIPTEEEIAKVVAQRDEPYTAHMVDVCFVASGPPPVYELAASVLGSLNIQALPQSSASQPTSAPDASLASV
ncbi:hypothetical protein ONZ45_g4719 [Pleurotus djamor]|nr:hypothetical protein ONZ45_g4719 [Pleurotus djamor]